METPRIKKIERTDTDVDNSAYEFKIPYVHTVDVALTALEKVML